MQGRLDWPYGCSKLKGEVPGGTACLFAPTRLHAGVANKSGRKTNRSVLFDFIPYKSFHMEKYAWKDFQLHPTCFCALTKGKQEDLSVEGKKIDKAWIDYCKRNDNDIRYYEFKAYED